MSIQDWGIEAPWGRFDPTPLHLRPNGRADILARGLERLTRLREELIAKLIVELDEAEGDPDLEPSLAGAAYGSSLFLPHAPTDDREFDPAEAEPSLGWTLSGEPGGGYTPNEYERELDESDHEPTLGSPAGSMNQARWAQGGTSERELVCEDEGAQCDDEGHEEDDDDREMEPSLGWTTTGVFGAIHDGELDESDHEPSCGWNLRAGEANSAAALDPATVFGEPEGRGGPSGVGQSEPVQAVIEQLRTLPRKHGGGNVIAFPGTFTIIAPGVAYGRMG